MRRALAVAVLAAASLVPALPARAAHAAELSISDDQALLGAPPAEVDREIGFFKALGFDRVGVSAYWRDHAPAPDAQARPAGFDAADPASAGYRWDTLDRVVGAASLAGLRVRVVITTPAPLWATADPARGNPLWRPDPAEFAAFAHAVAARYAGAVDTFSLMNEPNQAVWLQPQSDATGAVAPHLYRALVEAATPRIRAAAPGAQVLVGELAPGGSTRHSDRSPIRPLEFLRTMACRDARYRPLRTPRCKGFRPLAVDAISTHPYAFARAPNARSPKPDDAAIGDERRLFGVLDRLTGLRALVPTRGRRLTVRYTEFGYKTNPLDTYSGIPLDRQSRYLQEAAFRVWRTPRIRELNQFRILDGAVEPLLPGARQFHQFQTGLLFRSGYPKPSVFGVQSPFAIARPVLRCGHRTLFWGQVRPGEEHPVTLERAARAAGPFRSVARLETDRRGYFARLLPARAGWYRYRYSPANTLPSGVVSTAPRDTSDVLRLSVRRPAASGRSGRSCASPGAGRRSGRGARARSARGGRR